MIHKGIVVGMTPENEPRHSLEEIIRLAETANINVRHKMVQNVKKINPATCIGKGKVHEIADLVKKDDINVVVFDFELTPSQESNLEKLIDTRIIDRTGIILDIFARRAHTKEGKLQVELAQLTYKLSRLKGVGVNMSRLGGGIGTRGPGEQKLEVDRRTIRDRISKLKDELKCVEKSRNLHHRQRRRRNLIQIAIVGYTNAGKSTLINLLTSANAFVEDKLFATLDPLTKKLYLPNGTHAVITDTVGFIERLPHHLVDAFKSTFEEVKEANLILHIIDVANDDFFKQTETVKEVLASMHADHIPTLYIYNKIDVKNIDKETFLRHPKERPFVMMSAKDGTGSEELIEKMQTLLA